MAITDADRLRQLLGETIPVGRTDADTLFSDETIEDLLLQADGALDAAAAAGWDRKAAHFANLVNITEGNAAREMSDLRINALAMVRHFEAKAGGRVRIGKIRRRAPGES